MGKGRAVVVRLAGRGDLKWIIAEGTAARGQLGFLCRTAIAQKIARGQAVVAEADGRPAGFVIFGSLRRPVVLIFQTFVVPAMRGRGVGRRMVMAVQRVAAALGVEMLRAVCWPDIAANGFWQACGFRRAGTRPGGRSRGLVLNVWEIAADAKWLQSSGQPAPLSRDREGALGGPNHGARH